MLNVRQETGKKVKELRLSKGLSQEQFAEKIGINAQQLSRIECGKSYLTYKVLEALCDTFEKQPYYFFTYKSIKLCRNDMERIKAICESLENLESEKIAYIEKVVMAFEQ